MIKLYVPVKKDRDIMLRCTQRLPDDKQCVPDTHKPRARTIPNKRKS